MEGGGRASPAAALHKAHFPGAPELAPQQSSRVSLSASSFTLPNPAQPEGPPSFPLSPRSCLRAFPDHPSPESEEGRAWPQGPNHWLCHLLAA